MNPEEEDNRSDLEKITSKPQSIREKLMKKRESLMNGVNNIDEALSLFNTDADLSGKYDKLMTALRGY